MLGKMFVGALVACSLLTAGEALSADTDWMVGKVGAFAHYLPDAKTYPRVDDFDVKGLVAQLKAMRADFFVITLGQNAGYYCAPNATLETLGGFAPHARCSKRDVPAEIIAALRGTGIRFGLYLPCQPATRDDQMETNLGFPRNVDARGGASDRKFTDAGTANWAKCVAAWARRYGRDVSFWWFDGAYAWLGFNGEIAARYRAACRAGNPDVAIAFNAGDRCQGAEKWSDVWAGEESARVLSVVPTSRWAAPNLQWQVLTFLGKTWGEPSCRFADEPWRKWLSAVKAKGGCVTFDLHIDLATGRLEPAQADQFRRLQSTLPRDELRAAFTEPSAAARPHIWWHWMNGNVSKAGITADLEAMARVGLGGVQLFDAGLEIPAGSVAFGTDAWFDHVAFAARECERLGLSFGIANCSGWTSSGGPWVTPEHAMKFVTTVETNVCGPACVAVPPPPKETHGYYADIALLAFPKPCALADIPDLPHQTFRLRGDEVGPVGVPPIPDGAFPPGSCVETNRIVDLTPLLRGDAPAAWRVPAGEWTLVRVGCACNGRRNRPPSRAGDGLETDKLSRRATDLHFDAYVARVVAAAGGCRAFDNVLIDSFEVKGQNWTQGFEREFARRRGYAIGPYLPVLSGHPVESVAATRRFLADYRKTIGELFVENYAERFAERCHSLGLKFACEPYGNGPFNDLAYAATCDIPMGEFWTRRGDGVSMWTRWGHRYNGNGALVAAAARFWNRETIGAEAFTAYPTATSGRWLEHPASMKAQGDRVLAEGVNRFYFHRYAHQPWTNPTRYPGMTMAYYGSHFERTQTWWETGFRAYVGYLTRVQAMLRCGRHVSDILVCSPDDAPSFGTEGAVPDGWKADRCTESGLARQRRADPRTEARYRLVARSDEDIAARLREVGCARDFACDDPSVSWDHRRTGESDVYFVATAARTARRVKCSFRDFTPQAELWHPETGEMRRLDLRREGDRGTVDLDLAPEDACFVVFRKRPTEGVVPARAWTTIGAEPVAGPWRVSFHAPGRAEPVAQTNLARLIDWTASPDDNIRYFSGTAVYETTLAGTDAERVVLDLGEVHDIAEVELDGMAKRTLWRPPYRLDVTDAVRGRKSVRLKIGITNRWPNRLIGDERLFGASGNWKANNRWQRPVLAEFPDWLQRSEPDPSGRTTFTTCRLWRADDALLPSGLIGPVRLIRMSASTPLRSPPGVSHLKCAAR